MKKLVFLAVFAVVCAVAGCYVFYKAGYVRGHADALTEGRLSFDEGVSLGYEVAVDSVNRANGKVNRRYQESGRWGAWRWE